MEKKIYESKKTYSKKYNKENISIQLNRSLVQRLRENIGDQSIKSYIENLIKSQITNL